MGKATLEESEQLVPISLSCSSLHFERTNTYCLHADLACCCSQTILLECFNLKWLQTFERLPCVYTWDFKTIDCIANHARLRWMSLLEGFFQQIHREYERIRAPQKFIHSPIFLEANPTLTTLKSPASSIISKMSASQLPKVPAQQNVLKAKMHEKALTT